MWLRSPPVATLSAGATTSASSAGPISGTMIWRGLLAVSAARRRASVSSALRADAPRARRSGTVMGCAIADISAPFELVTASGFGSAGGWSGGREQRVAGQLEIDVVQARRPGCDLGRAQLLGVERPQCLGRSALVQRHGDACTDGERVLPRDPPPAKALEHSLSAA